MANCPKCNSAIHDDYGMVTCPTCGAIVFIDMDGMAHFGAQETAAVDLSAPSEPSRVVTSVEHQTEVEIGAETLADTPFDLGLGASESEPPLQPVEFAPIGPIDSPTESESPTPIEAGVEPMVEPLANADFVFDALDEPSATQPPESSSSSDYPAYEPAAEAGPESTEELNMNLLLGYEEAPATDQAPAEDSSIMGSSEDPLGLNAYANSEISQAKDGLLSFRLLISGIDSKELRQSLREALQDTRFGWTAGVLMSKIRKGVLRIDNVSAVKASILVNRIKRLPIQIRWEQYAITQMEGIEDADIPDLGAGEHPDSSVDDTF